jgi:hypothetical protein
MKKLSLLALLLCPAVSLWAVIPWPTEPFDASQPLGNSYGEYQNYGSYYYMHPGIDIMQPAGTPVYAVKAGWVKAVLTTSAELHWRVAVGDSSSAAECDGWLYAHLDLFTIAVNEGDYVDSGQYLGDLVWWPVADFHHLHFVKIRHSGLTWTSDWEFISNPLDELVAIDDPDAPYFVEISPGSPFRFCEDNTDNFFPVGAPLSGNVDIIAQAHDKKNHPDWVLTPYSMTYEIQSDSVFLGPYLAFMFTGQLLWDQSHHVVFKNGGPCVSQGNYDVREFYEIITNHDADTLITPSDISGHWATGQIPNDNYTITVHAYDRFGNHAQESMAVTTANYYDVSGSISFSDENPFLEDVEVSVDFSGTTEMTDDQGLFELFSQPAGRYPVTADRIGYETWLQIAEVFGEVDLQIELTPAPYVNGDVDFNQLVNVSDIVYLVNFVFGNGTYPVPWAAAVAIDSDPSVNVSDIVYMINFVFGDGPPPGEG